jgi:hypothetical protein
MSKKIHNPEEIVANLRQVDVLASQGQSAATCAPHGEITAAKLTLKPDHSVDAGL